jgi:hypothetical protein
MKPKTIKIFYWVFTIIFSFLMLMDGIIKIMQVEEGVEIMKHLGYPVYVLTILGIANVLGAIAILQNRFRTIKEWAYAGFTFHFIGASMSRAYGGDGAMLIISPLIFLAVMFVNYYFWKKLEYLKTK